MKISNKNGFIGGASFMLNNKTLCFLGDISHHTDYDKILDFLMRIQYSLLKQVACMDGGSM